ncbi:AcrR family transcriptional regulator [Microbacterium terrae]|uniref:HTH-type transcriptional repressor KstR2 n=1 Tax=Microbacterium terrae TaxID=69369 RepID=A0A0M2HGW1_9MICO|nr:TetR/AcrR family transcriptional regulator [Microbacterium terrae]KJL44020.1 HTH-type transcriptional repressor KstR2 [Microbacterium terrae]MBP1079446.1 AcrR family transcriptional regulator [Microbacterium terrae]GLJ98847.1 hypothetical protein GCM10017594_20440 [Microbacterium terrae]
MGTPTDVQGTAVEESSRTTEIRNIAAQLFEQSGFSATTMSDIATAVGILPGSLYHHFTSKEEIALEILAEFEHDRADLIQTLTGLLDDVDRDPRDRLVDVSATVIAFSLRHRAAMRLFAYDAPSVSTERLRAAVGTSAPSLERVWKRAVDRLIPSPDASLDTERLALALHFLSINAAINTPEADDPEALARLQISMLLDGFLAAAPTDEELDASDAMRAALEGIASWGKSSPAKDPTSREHIVNAARAEFARRGYDATTVRDIANAAGVRMGTLYRRVGSKEEILTEIVETYKDHIERAYEAIRAAEDSDIATLDALALIFVEAKHRFQLESEIVKVGWSSSRVSIPAVQAFQESTSTRLHYVESVLAHGRESGDIRDLGLPSDVGPQFRFILWVPYPYRTKADRRRTLRFLRNSVLRGLLQPR